MATLYDHLGRPVETPRRPEKAQLAIAAVRDQWSTYPSNGLTPQRLAAILREADEGDVERQAELFEEMEEKDAHLFSVLQTRKNAVIGLPRTVLPASDDDRDQKVATFVEEALDELDIEDLLLDALDAIGKGFSVCEIQWAFDGRRVVPREVEWVHARRFRWDRREIRLLTDAEPALGERLAANKFVVHTYKARSGWPSRAGVLRVCAWAYLFKNYSVKDWVAFAEVFGMPLRLGKYDQSASKVDKDALQLAVQMLGSDAAGIISKSTEIEFVESKVNKGADVFQALAEWCDRAQSKAVLGQTLTTEVGSSGSYAASKTHGDVRHDLLEADARAVAKTLQRDLIGPIVGFNFGWDVPLPRLELDTREPEDLKALAETYGVLVEKVRLPIGQAHLYERFGIPEPSEGDAVVGAEAAPGGAEPQALKRDQRARRLALARRLADAQRGLDELAERATAKAGDAVTAMFRPLLERVASATDLESLRTDLLEAYPDMDPADLEDLVGRSLHVADLAGRLADG